MMFIDQIAEIRIKEAMEQGQLDDLPGQGKPLNLDEDGTVPEEYRMAYRILKNSGFVPPEINLRSEINALEAALSTLDDDTGRDKVLKKIHCLYARLDNMHNRHMNLALREEYYRKVINKFNV